jgi:hypothetical protein
MLELGTLGGALTLHLSTCILVRILYPLITVYHA